jgi:hypothetical protein
MRATDVEEIDLRIHRQARATIRAHRVKLRDRELEQQARPESAERLGDDDPETVQPRPIREDRFRTGPLAADLHLERLDEYLVGDMHSCSPLPHSRLSLRVSRCSAIRSPAGSGRGARDRSCA